MAECEYLVAHCDITKSCSVSAVIHTRVMYTYKYIVYIVLSSFLGSLHVISIASRKRSGDLLYLFGLFRDLQHSDVVLAEVGFDEGRSLRCTCLDIIKKPIALSGCNRRPNVRPELFLQ